MNGLFWLGVLVALGAFLSLAEIAFAASRRARLQARERGGSAAARLALLLHEQPGRFFTVILVGVNVIGVLGGMLAEALIAPQLESWLARAPWSLASSVSLGMVASMAAFLLVTVAFILFSDLIPKRIAMAAPERAAEMTALPMRVLMSVFRPLAWALDGLATWILRRFGVTLTRDEVVTSEEILAMTEAAAQSGEVLAEEQTLISKVFALDQRLVTSSMTTRDEIVFLLQGDSTDRISEVVRAHPQRRFPVCDVTLDRPVGYVDTHDLFSRMLAGEPVALTAETVKRDLLVFPDTLTLLEALEAFQQKSQDFALIVNEYSLVVGLMTLQDVMDTVTSGGNWAVEERMIVQRDEHSWLIDGLTPIEEVRNVLGVGRFDSDENFETISGFLMWKLRKVPRRADAVDHDGLRFEVVAVENYRIDQILVTRTGIAAEVATRPDGREADR